MEWLQQWIANRQRRQELNNQKVDLFYTLFDNKNQCEIVAQRRHDETIALFKKARQPIESLKVSCVQ